MGVTTPTEEEGHSLLGDFQYLSGEDPYLGHVLAHAAVKAIQATGVIATATSSLLKARGGNVLLR